MKKSEFFIQATKAKCLEKLSWVISAFSLIREDYSAWKKDPYPYRIVQTPTQVLFVNPNNFEELIPLEDSVAGEPAFKFKERLTLPALTLPNQKEEIETTYGNLFFNYCCLVHAFGAKMDYINKSVSVSDIENKIAPILKDTPKSEDQRSQTDIYVDEYLKFCDSLAYLTNFTQLCVWAATEKVITAPPGIAQLKNKLYEQYKDRITDPAVLAEIDKQLIAFDAEYLKGDPGGDNFLMGAKMRNIARKKMFLSMGAESGLDDEVSMDPMKNSLEEGWDISKFPTMNDNMRAGSYNRGRETQLGGEAVKWLLRASSNITITGSDCGTKMGKTVTVEKDNFKNIIGFTAIINGQNKIIANESELEPYMGSKLMIRSPMYCKLEHTDYCELCVGQNLTKVPTGLSLAISEYGSGFMLLFMKAMHGKELSVAKLDYKKSFS